MLGSPIGQIVHTKVIRDYQSPTPASRNGKWRKMKNHYPSLRLFISFAIALTVWGILGSGFGEQTQCIIGGFAGVAIYEFFKSVMNRTAYN